MDGMEQGRTPGVVYKTGIVVESKPGFAKVRFSDLDDLVTQWLPQIFNKTQDDKTCSTLDVGEQVSCIMDAALEDGCILGAIYSDADAAPTGSKDVWRKQFKDGGSVEYDRANGKMSVVTTGDLTANVAGNLDVAVYGDASIRANGAALVKAPTITLDGDVTVTKTLTVAGLLSYSSGLSGSGGGGAGAQISGGVAVTGGDVTADSIGLKTHRHNEQGDGAPTSAAIA